MPEELGFKASIEGFDKVEAGLNNITKGLAATSAEAGKLDSTLKKTGSTTTANISKLNTGISNVSASAKEAVSNFTGFGASLPTAGVALLTLAITEGIQSIYEYATSVSKTAQANIDLNKSLEQSKASVAGTVASLQSLVSIAQDVNRSDAERSQAIGKLNNDYKGFNNALSLANINTSESIALIDRQTNAIVRNAQIKGLENLISKEAEKRAEALTQKVGENLSMLQKARAFALSFGGGPVVGGVADALNTSLENTNETLAESEQRTRKFTEVLNQLLSEGAAAGDLFTAKFKKVKDVIKEAKDEADGLRKVFQTISTIRFEGKFDELLKNVKPDSKQLNTITVPVRVKAEITDDSLFTTQEYADLSKGLTEGLRSIAANAGAAFSETLANAITGSADVGDFFTGIFKTIGAGLKQLGQYFVQAGIEILIVKKMLTANPYLAIAAGIALQVLGGVLQNSISKKQAFATGGLVGGTGNRDTISALLTPGEFVLTKSAVQRIGVDRLEAMNKGAAPTNFAGGGIVGGSSTVIIPDVVLRGSDLILVFDRASATKSRQG